VGGGEGSGDQEGGVGVGGGVDGGGGDGGARRLIRRRAEGKQKASRRRAEGEQKASKRQAEGEQKASRGEQRLNHGQKRERQLTSITVASQKEALEASTYVHQLSCKRWYICDGLWQS
jgi:hypothetical protein